MEIMGLLGPVYSLNTVLDEQHRRLSFVNFGPINESHLDAVNTAWKRYAEISLKKRYRTVITTAGGHPLDSTYYQTVKGMVRPWEALEPGGKLS